ncbi:zinc ribbon domain-containing protein [Fusibacter paucivorans]|uniref:Zinc ribbon domain-containing protein n=1 Tax=Fusibacter paucivorans TaxID=76009 RepID=A0ABS5PT06_9FIRM|nr:zinc ribbon domain-containing protein [Fusibacter paucivorans]MBS7528308.1 zinc ribbon domain-containing protein [Fusibacter paucivorans]
MKKATRLTMAMTVILLIYSCIATYVVFGNHLFYFNSKWGYLFAVTYRWGYILLLLFGVITFVQIQNRRKQIPVKKDKKVAVNQKKSKRSKSVSESSKAERNHAKFCSKCGALRENEQKFCEKCGSEY